jgi:hypothetical protein
MKQRALASLVLLLLIAKAVFTQNTGPFSPDHSGFIPAENSKVVNLTSGDFFYTLPIVTIPGPQGGFPLGLSYEAGITFDQEASWVGLGWSLTPGSINRAVNGYPDDWREKEIHYVVPDGDHTIKQDLNWSGYVSYGLQAKLGVNKLLHGFYQKTTHQRQVNSKRAYGALYAKEGASAAITAAGSEGYYSMDVYAVDDDYTTDSDASEMDMNFMQFHNYDQYNVSVQGLSGYIQPRINDVGPLAFDPIDATLFTGGSHVSKTDYHWPNENQYNTSQNVYFSFIHKHNSYFESNLEPFAEANSSGNDAESIFATGALNNVIELPSSIQDQYLQSSAYNITDERRVEANYIEYFTNTEIASSPNDCKTRGFIETISGRSSFDSDGIGAFVITDKAGMSYHFGLPVYQYEEVFNHETAGDKQRIIKADKYAYTWLLTAVVGPDYIDVNDDGISEDDLGYWVKFDYGLWSDGYQWRIPYSGDINNGTSSFNYTGRKQIYYLDRITTATHSAFFIKDIRTDGKGFWKQLFRNINRVGY